MNHLNPAECIGRYFNSVQSPARYLGGESGIYIKKDEDCDITFTIAFPDVYEIAMSNQAIKIIYNGLNQIPHIRCERVFAPEKDFESLLQNLEIPLYTLESYIPLFETDIIGFSIGYELGITGVFSILSLGKIPIFKTERKESDPIVIAGGVGVTNPAPLADFFDGVFIGEAEDALFELVNQLADAKKNGAQRCGLIQILKENPYVWMPGKHTVRAVFSNFGKIPSVPAYFPLPSVKPVQDHGVVEIMRGCPNGCRFCHAGIYYRPQRVKSAQLIIDEVDKLVFEAGYREISLTSLSSADYPQIDKLLELLNNRYGKYKVSFQLPSLKVNSFTLPLLQRLSEVRKSGLTFAVETPDEFWQLCLNKEVYHDRLVDIILEAKKFGWNKAKFYFMIGLPLPESTEKKSEAEIIVDFLIEIQKKTGIQCNVNVGTFIPKPHTPFERVKQISPEESYEAIEFIKNNLPRGKFHVGMNNEFVSFIEGLVSRGDINSGQIMYNAWKKGSRLDAWEDNLRNDKQYWLEAIEEADNVNEKSNSIVVREQILRERTKTEILPWNEVSLGPASSFYIHEYEKSQKGIITEKCKENCKLHCGVCSNKTSVNVYNNIQYKNNDIQIIIQSDNISNTGFSKGNLNFEVSEVQDKEINIPILWRVVFKFVKSGAAVFLPHLATQEIYHKAFLRSGLPVMFTNGFNPLPRMEFASSLSLGIASECEIGSCMLRNPVECECFINNMNKKLPTGVRISECMIFPVTNLKKRESLASLLWGAIYEYSFFEKGTEKELDCECECELFNKIKSFFVNYSASKEIIAISENNNFEITVPFKNDRKLRDALSDCIGLPLYEFCSIKKKQTLAIPYGNGSNVADENVNGFEAVTYFEVYEKIAKENAALIKVKEESDKKKQCKK